MPELGGDPGEPLRTSRRATIATQVGRLVTSIRTGDESMVETTVLALSRRSRWLAPLALLVGAFAMLFQGVKLIFTNWRLTLVQILPAMWIWAAMLDLKAHALHGKEFHLLRGPLLWLVLLVIAGLTTASFFLNAVFATAISKPGPPQIRPSFAEAKRHIHTILAWGLPVGLALGFATMVVDRWGKFWFSLTLSIVVAIMMVTYVAVPARLIGVKSARSTRDKLTASAVGGAVGAVVCTPPFRVGPRRHIAIGLTYLSLPGNPYVGRCGCLADWSNELGQGDQDEREAGCGQGSGRCGSRHRTSAGRDPMNSPFCPRRRRIERLRCPGDIGTMELSCSNFAETMGSSTTNEAIEGGARAMASRTHGREREDRWNQPWC